MWGRKRHTASKKKVKGEEEVTLGRRCEWAKRRKRYTVKEWPRSFEITKEIFTRLKVKIELNTFKKINNKNVLTYVLMYALTCLHAERNKKKSEILIPFKAKNDLRSK